jgi:hypothetical protein
LTVTDQLATKVFIETLDGKKLFKFRKLNAYDNQRVYFTTVQQLLMSIAGLATNKDGKPVKNLSDVDISRFATILQQIDFDVFHLIAMIGLKAWLPLNHFLIVTISASSLKNCI